MKVFATTAVIIHALFLVSIFYIYFQSPILQNLPLAPDDDDAVANRVVVFVADGLRAESFLQHQANRTKFLQRTLLTKGSFGISSTRVPTESRPGHVALFAGFYEDPSSIFKGWKENPVDFDSVFNRSHKTYSWGSPDILSIFSSRAGSGKIYADSYSPNIEDFSRNSNTSIVDVWVFEKVKKFYENPENCKKLNSGKKHILFLHLLGLDTSGHVHKPYSDLFTENLIIVDKGIQQMVQLIDNVTNYDKRTTYIFTSDHGMTDKGSHGSGLPVEIETPFLIWGAGVNHWNSSRNGDVLFHVDIDGIRIPSWNINQADIAPLISSLLGQALPKNNIGKLPRQYLNASMAYVANAMWKNAEQLYQQYYRWKQQSSQKWFQWNISPKEFGYVTIINKLRNDIETANYANHYEHVITMCDILIDVTLEAIEFYHMYYKNELLLTVTLAMVGWLLIALGKIYVSGDIFSEIDKRLIALGLLVGVAICGYNSLQGTPKTVTFYYVLPVFVWIPVFSKWKAYFAVINWKVFGQSLLVIACSELCVMAFFQRSVLSVFLILNALYLANNLRINKVKSRMLLCLMLSSNAVLAIFPVLPVVEKDSNHPLLLLTGILLWAIGIVAVNIKSRENAFNRWIQTIASLSLLLNLLYSLNILESGVILSWFNRATSWILTGVSIIMPLTTTVSIPSRLSSLIINLSGPFMMLSLSYEPLFLLAFTYSLFIWMETENKLFNQNEELSQLFFSSKLNSFKPVDFHDFRRALTFVVYILVSFFGTGNMATVSSFDPNWVRLFVATFSPFVMTGLIVFKLLIPILISICILRSLQIIVRVRAQTLFLLIFIICDLMCLNFFYLIKNKGSWLDIGSSISHFVIMECTTIVLIILYGCAKFITEISITNGWSKYHGRIRYMLPYDNKTNKD